MNASDTETKLKTCEAALAQQKQQVTELNAEIENLSYAISHDLRAPLRAIQGFAKALSEDYEQQLDGDARRYLQIIVSGSTQMAQMIDAILSLSRLGRQPVNRSRVDVNRLVQAIIDEFNGRLQDRQVSFQIGALPDTDADLNLLRHVWIHLIANAIKFTATTPEATITIGADTRPAETVYFIRDNGVGFDMDYATKLFGLFQRFHTEKEFPGVGAGLALAQRLVRKHGGNIWAESKINEGSTFFFSLPTEPVSPAVQI